MNESAIAYPGKELQLFAAAKNWKRYWSSQIRPFVRGRVLEVGGGMGENISYLMNPAVTEWQSIEPDGPLFSQLTEHVATLPESSLIKTAQMVVNDLSAEAKWDAALYIDVLEHIEDDAAELQRIATRLAPGGAVVVLCPAHQALFSEFDASIGHYRRYNRKMMQSLQAQGLRLEKVFYLDCVGMAASIANRLMLRQSSPSAAQIKLWDRWMVQASRVIDPLIAHRLGKTIVAIWRANRLHEVSPKEEPPES